MELKDLKEGSEVEVQIFYPLTAVTTKFKVIGYDNALLLQNEKDPIRLVDYSKCRIIYTKGSISHVFEAVEISYNAVINVYTCKTDKQAYIVSDRRELRNVVNINCEYATGALSDWNKGRLTTLSHTGFSCLVTGDVLRDNEIYIRVPKADTYIKFYGTINNIVECDEELYKMISGTIETANDDEFVRWLDEL